MHIRKQFKCIEIPLNHRLVRHMIKFLWDHIKEFDITKNQDYNMVMTYKYLKRIWKRPNYGRRARNGKRTYYQKKCGKRYLYLFSNWSFSRMDEWYSKENINNSNIDIDQLLMWCVKARDNVPF
jgi:hypothetical protein